MTAVDGFGLVLLLLMQLAHTWDDYTVQHVVGMGPLKNGLFCAMVQTNDGGI